jgi:hypothetical protein
VRKLITMAICVMTVAGSAVAAEALRAIGAGWLLTADEDPFGVGKKVIATKTVPEGWLGVRCIDRDFSIVVHFARGSPLQQGEEIAVQFRADRRPIARFGGKAIDGRTVVMNLSKVSGIAEQLQDAEQAAFRFMAFERGASFDFVMKVGAPNAALEEVYAECFER